ncbi:outer membrane protein assembly factor BamE [Halomonas sp. GXIMD04776]|uniref:outer membrane protein assembly factor BamE n=1 Tax=Halomonas sp. GXIMD04776 TaxID=3415605 RepID=UPI003C9F29F9
MQNLIKIVAFSTALALMSGCNYFSVYKRDLPQGNLFTQDMVQQLEPGMTREQVVYVMGMPLLRTPFDQNQWEYVSRLDEAYAGVKQRRVTLTFANDRLVDIKTSGDMNADMEMSPDLDPGPGAEPAGAEPLPNMSPTTDPGEEPGRRGERI